MFIPELINFCENVSSLILAICFWHSPGAVLLILPVCAFHFVCPNALEVMSSMFPSNIRFCHTVYKTIHTNTPTCTRVSRTHTVDISATWSFVFHFYLIYWIMHAISLWEVDQVYGVILIGWLVRLNSSIYLARPTLSELNFYLRIFCWWIKRGVNGDRNYLCAYLFIYVYIFHTNLSAYHTPSGSLQGTKQRSLYIVPPFLIGTLTVVHQDP